MAQADACASSVIRQVIRITLQAAAACNPCPYLTRMEFVVVIKRVFYKVQR